MQPYLFPYIGYFQLIAAADRFVIYDTVKYTKKGWINRNRFLRDGEPITFTLPIARGADDLDIGERQVAEDFAPSKLCSQIAQAYRRAPFLAETMPLIDAVLHYRADTLFLHLREGLTRTCAHLGIETPILTASTLEGLTELRRQERVIDICTRLSATTYVNPIGGTALYDPEAFAARGIALRFLKARPQDYRQFDKPFVPWLSIIDVLMFNGRDGTRARLPVYDLLTADEAAPAGQPSLPEAA